VGRPPHTVTEEAFAVFRRRLLVGAIALLVPALAGCEAGLNAPTLEFHPAAAGATTSVNDISISNVFVLGPPSGSTLPAGSSASLFLGLYNNGGNGDTLVSASAPAAAQSVTITGGSVSLPPQTGVDLTGPEPKVVLSGLTTSLQGGENVDVTLNFQTAGPVTLDVPVEPQSFYYSTYSQAPPSTPTAPIPPPATPATPTTTPSGKSTRTPATPTATPTR
jgi:copper(I)-binding protein